MWISHPTVCDPEYKAKQLAHKKRYVYQKILQSIRRIYVNDGQNKRTNTL